MSISTWFNITHGMDAALDKGYKTKTRRQRRKREVTEAWECGQEYCQEIERELTDGCYQMGDYRHFRLQDKKKPRDISVLPFRDRVVQNGVKDAIEPLLLRRMTDDMMGGLPGRGVLANDARHSVVRRMKRLLGDSSLRYYLQGDIRKFYDSVDNVTTMRLVEQAVKDKRTLAIVRQHLFAQKKLAIGDPFSHLMANLNMSVIIRKAKEKYGQQVEIINFADDFIAFAREKETLEHLRKDMHRWSREMRLHYKRMYVHPVPCDSSHGITFCGYKYRRGQTLLTQHTKKRYIRARHRRRSVASYNGLLQVADSKHLRHLVEIKDNRHMADKIRRPFAGRPMKVETLEGINHTIVAVSEKPSRQQHSDTYMHIQAIADALGLIVYSTSSPKIVEYLRTQTMPVRDVKIVHDWSGFYYDGTVYTDAEEEEMIRKQYNIPK